MPDIDITDRDRFVIGKALLYAIKYIDSLPEHLREYSDRDDMVTLLKLISPGTVDRAKAHERGYNLVVEKTGQPVDIGIAKHRKVPDDLK